MRKLGFTTLLLLALAAWGVAQQPAAVQIINGPVVEHVSDTDAVIAWSTNVEANTVLRYGTEQNSLNHTARAPWGGTTHRVTVKNLDPGKTYYFKVVSAQASGTGTRTESDIKSFSTTVNGVAPQGQDNTGFISGQSTASNASIINYVEIENMTANQAVILFKTTVASSAVMRFGTDANNMSQNAQAPWGGTDHRITMTNLQPSTPYYFQIKAGQAEGSGTSSYSLKFKLTTPAAGAGAVQHQQPEIVQR